LILLRWPKAFVAIEKMETQETPNKRLAEWGTMCAIVIQNQAQASISSTADMCIFCPPAAFCKYIGKLRLRRIKELLAAITLFNTIEQLFKYLIFNYLKNMAI